MDTEVNCIAVSKGMQEVMQSVKVAASTNVPVLITGECGSGKKIFAQAIHKLSPRANHPIVVVQCTEASEELIESEVFGYESRSAPKSRPQRIGCFELAKGGSLLFDDIEDLSGSMQLRVLRILEERKIRPLGGRVELPIDVRVLATLERNSDAIYASGKLRPELFTFLQAFQIHVPPLRDRKEDLPFLIRSILGDVNSRDGKHVVDVGAEVRDIFLCHVWPGNIRELQCVLEHAVVFCQGNLIRRQDLPANFGKFPIPLQRYESAISFPVGVTYESMERALICQTLTATNGNKTRTADLLGISLKTLHNKLHDYRSSKETSELQGVTFPLGMTVEQLEHDLIMQTLKRVQNNKTRTADLLGISLKTIHNKLKIYSSTDKSA